MGSATTVLEGATLAESRGRDVGRGTGVVSSFWFAGRCCNSCNSSNSSILIDTRPPPHEPCRTLKLSNVRSSALFDFSQRRRRASRASLASKSDCSASITSDRVATVMQSASAFISSAAFAVCEAKIQFHHWHLHLNQSINQSILIIYSGLSSERLTGLNMAVGVE